MNKVLYRLCRHCVGIMDGWIPYPSTILCETCELSLYKTRKELKKLKEQSLVISERYCEVGEDGNYLISGYTITEKAKETEEYKKALAEERKLCQEVYGYDMFPELSEVEKGGWGE